MAKCIYCNSDDIQATLDNISFCTSCFKQWTKTLKTRVNTGLCQNCEKPLHGNNGYNCDNCVRLRVAMSRGWKVL